ncbi:hypothetical protein LCGC14_2558290, partial [marine sediment metagenome]
MRERTSFKMVQSVAKPNTYRKEQTMTTTRIDLNKDVQKFIAQVVEHRGADEHHVRDMFEECVNSFVSSYASRGESIQKALVDCRGFLSDEPGPITAWDIGAYSPSALYFGLLPNDDIPTKDEEKPQPATPTTEELAPHPIMPPVAASDEDKA